MSQDVRGWGWMNSSWWGLDEPDPVVAVVGRCRLPLAGIVAVIGRPVFDRRLGHLHWIDAASRLRERAADSDTQAEQHNTC
jgi:hypothetical protein